MMKKSCRTPISVLLDRLHHEEKVMTKVLRAVRVALSFRKSEHGSSIWFVWPLYMEF